MVLAEPGNVDMLVSVIVLGLLAPVLAFSIASGSGLSALSTISYSTSSFGIRTGITPYNPDTAANNASRKTDGQDRI